MGFLYKKDIILKNILFYNTGFENVKKGDERSGMGSKLPTIKLGGKKLRLIEW